MIIRDKRGEGNETILAEIVPLMVIILVFISLIIFVSKAATSSFVVEELYAKKIALLIENGVPGLNVNIDISDLYAAWKKRYY